MPPISSFPEPSVPPRIALSALQQRDYLTGTGRYLAELYRALPQVRPEAEYLLYVKPDQRRLYPSGGDGACQKVVIGCPSSPPRRALWELRHFARLLREDQVDLYHGPANFLPPRKVCPYVCTLHDMVYFHNPERTSFLRAKYWQWYIRATWRHADLILTVSEFSRQEIRRYLPVPAGRIRVIPNGVDGRFFAPNNPASRSVMRRSLGLDSRYILYVGRLDPDKNVRRLIAAFARLCAAGLRDTELVLAGAKDYESSGLPLLAKKLGVSDRVRFLGYVAEEHLVPLYQDAAVFCYPSLNEGFGLPPLEAMAAGVPVVTSNLSSLPEVVGDAGVQVDPRSVKEIARGIRSVLNTQRGRELAEAGRARARTFTWERTARETAACYDEVLSKGWR